MNQLEVRPQGDREIVMTRSFDAPRQLVFDAYTKPDLVTRWMLGPDGWAMPVCEMDVRPGGKFRYVWRNATKGDDLHMSGTYHEIEAPSRIVHAERFDEPWSTGDALVTTCFEEANGKTTVTQTMLMDSTEARDGILASGMESGVARSYERLDEVLSQ